MSENTNTSNTTTNTTNIEEKKEMNDFKYYCNKVIKFSLDADRDINEQFNYLKKICDLTSKNNSFRCNLTIDNYMVIMNKVIERYNNAVNEDNHIITNFYWDIMINFIASVKNIYKNILFKKEGPKYISEKTVNFTNIIKKCCVSKNGALKYKNQISGFLHMTRGLVGWSIEDRRIIGNWLKEMTKDDEQTNKSTNDDKTTDKSKEDQKEQQLKEQSKEEQKEEKQPIEQQKEKPKNNKIENRGKQRRKNTTKQKKN